MLRSIPSEAQLSALGLDPFLAVRGPDLQQLYAKDAQLLYELGTAIPALQRYESPATGLSFANEELAGLAQDTYAAADIAAIEETLSERGTLDIPLVYGTVNVGGEPRDIVMVAATEIAANGAHHGDMSSMIYLRDQIQTACAYMKLGLRDPDHYAGEAKTGKALLISALHLLSTDPQLARFENVIRLGTAAGQDDWPQISIKLDDLEGVQPNGWRNIQDTVQMLTHATLEALENGSLVNADLLDAHKQSLGAVVPLLTAVGFPRYDNSGSWEENAAPRTSVMSIETALLHKVKTLTANDPYGTFSFLKSGFDRSLHHLKGARSFDRHIDTMLTNGLEALGRRLPFETPDPEFDTEWVKYRQADAALVYVLRYGIPQLLAEYQTPLAINQDKPADAFTIEKLILDQLATLDDPETGGMDRYRQDAYQRLNFHTNVVQLGVNGIKRLVKTTVAHDPATAAEALDHKQWLRGQLTPAGEEAAWTHPLGQIASWAAERSLEAYSAGDPTTGEWYRDKSTLFFNRSLATITGEDQYHAALDENGEYKCRPVPAYKLPECYVAYELPDGRRIKVPSPHTPLNWSIAMAAETLGVYKVLAAYLAASDSSSQ